jgi:ankyrin repeat protein
MIAENITDEHGDRDFSGFNSFVQVNRALYRCLNPALWRGATQSTVMTQRALTHLINTNNATRLRSFLQLGADVETCLPSFNTTSGRDLLRPSPLLVAAYLDNVSLARVLLENGAKVHYDDRLHYTALHAARSTAMVQLLFVYRADPERQDQRQRQPLHCYANRSNIAVMRMVLQRGVSVDGGGSAGGNSTPLHHASTAAAARLLLEFGADPRICCERSASTLHFAAAYGHIAVIHVLLQRWPEGIRAEDEQGHTPLHYATMRGKTSAVWMLLVRWPQGARSKSKCGTTPLHIATSMGCTNMIELLLECWPLGICDKTQDGSTPLHWAAEKGRVEAVKLLLRLWPAGMMERNAKSRTPLHDAASQGHAEVVNLLLEHWPEGARQKDNDGNTPLHTAAAHGHTAVVKLLVECWTQGKVEVNERGLTPLAMFQERYDSDQLSTAEGVDREQIVALLSDFKAGFWATWHWREPGVCAIT